MTEALRSAAQALLSYRSTPDIATTRAEDAAIARSDTDRLRALQSAFLSQATPNAILALLERPAVEVTPDAAPYAWRFKVYLTEYQRWSDWQITDTKPETSVRRMEVEPLYLHAPAQKTVSAYFKDIDLDWLAMTLCAADGREPHTLTYITTEPGVQEPYGEVWLHYMDQAEKLRAAMLAEA